MKKKRFPAKQQKRKKRRKKVAEDAAKQKAAEEAEKKRAHEEKTLNTEAEHNATGDASGKPVHVLEENANAYTQRTESAPRSDAQPAPETTSNLRANASPASSSRVTRNWTTTRNRLSAIMEEANATPDDELADLCSKPFLPKFGETNEVPAFDEVAFRL